MASDLLLTPRERARLEVVREALKQDANPYESISKRVLTLGQKGETTVVKPERDESQAIREKWAVGHEPGPRDGSVIKILIKPGVEAKGVRCIGCGVEVDAGFCHTGKVLSDFTNLEIEQAKFFPLILESGIVKRRIRISKYTRGFICDSCASDSSFHTDPLTGRQAQRVITEARPVMQPKDERVGFRSNKGFNTRITR